MDPGSLQNLHDIVTPAPVSWLPPAPGCYALGLSLLLLLTWFSLNRYRAWQRDGYRREVLAVLAQIEKGLTDSTQYQQLLPKLPQLVKRTAIAAYGRDLVASLNGTDWLAFLDETGSTELFTKGSGRLLVDCSYQSDTWFATLSNEQVRGLYKAVWGWVAAHEVEKFQEKNMREVLKKISILNWRLFVMALIVLWAVTYHTHPSWADETPPAAKPDYSIMAGEWQRTDGGYLLKVSEVQADGRAAVTYFNPKPIHVAETAISTQAGLIKLFVRFQDENYEGSTYTLYYYAEKDALAGFYYQAVLDKTYEVVFLRKSK